MNTRQLKLLNYLLEQNNYVTANVLAKMFHVTPKTIYLDVNSLRSELEQYNLEIDKRPYRGILVLGDASNKLKAKKNASLLDERADIHLFDVEDRRQTLFIDLVLKGNRISLMTTAEKYYVSKTAILNDLDILSKTILSKFYVIFETNDKLIQAIGTEHNIQAACIDFFLNKLTKEKKIKLETYFDSDVYLSVVELCNGTQVINEKHMTDYYRQALFVTLLVFSSRIKNGYHIENEEFNLLEDVNFISEYHHANEIIDYFENRLSVFFTEEDKRILTKYLASYRTVKLDIDRTQYKELIDEIILRLEQTENITLSNRTELENQLYQHIPPMIMRLKNGVNLVNPLLSEIKTRFQPLFTVSWYVLSVIENEYNITLIEDEVSFITLYFQIAVNKSLNARKILVVCPYGVVSSKYIVNKLRLVLPRHDDIQSCSINDLNNNYTDGVDLIVSTSSQQIDTVIPIVRVSPFLDNVDYANVFRSYAKYIFLENPFTHEIAKKSGLHLPILKKYLKEEYLFFNVSFSSKVECLDFLISALEKDGIVKKDFRTSVYQREKVGSTALDNNVSLPHGIPSSVNKIGIAIMTLNKPIKWSEHHVDMIIMLAVPENKASEFNDIVVEVYSMIANTELITKLKKIKKKETFLNALYSN